MKETEFLYSVGFAGFALLNQDGTMPTPNDWQDVDNQGKERNCLFYRRFFFAGNHHD